MKLTIVIGRAGTGKSEYCLAQIAANLERSAEGAAQILLVPEHATFKLEKELAQRLSAKGFTRGHVFGFKRLAQRVLAAEGGAAKPSVTALGKKMLLARLLRRQATLTALGKAARQRNFTESLAAVIEEFKTYKITPDKLTASLDKLGDPALKDKLADLAVIYEGFGGSMAGRYVDGEDQLDALAAKVKTSALLVGADVWLDGFTFFNPQEWAVLAELAQAAHSITVTLSIAEPHNGRHGSPTDVFARQYGTYQALRRLAQQYGLTVEEIKLTRQRRLSEPLALLADSLYSFAAPLRPVQSGSPPVVIVESANCRREVEGVAADIIRLCRERNYHWRDIGVLIRDGDGYEELAATVFRDYGIPFFSDSKRRSVHHPLAELLRSALEAVHGWRYEPLFRCFKTDFFTVSRDDIDVLENYVLEFGIHGQRWTMPQDWQYVRRLSLEEDSEAAARRSTELTRINEIRRAVMQPLQALAEGLRQAADGAALATAAYDFLTALAVPEQLAERARQAADGGALAEAREHQQLWDNTVSLLEQIAAIAGDEALTVEEFTAVVNDGLENMTLSLIPPGLDYVTLASFDQNSLDNVKAIYILGCTEGCIPKRCHETGLLSDADRRTLAQIGLMLAAGTSGDNFAERFLIYSAVTRAREYLWLSYPLADNEGGGLCPSPLLDRIRYIMNIEAVKSLPLDALAGPVREAVAAPRQAVATLARAFAHYRQYGELAEFWRDVYNWALRRDDEYHKLLRTVLAGLAYNNRIEPLSAALAARLYTKNSRMAGSVTRFERFRECPFRHFAQYGLTLKERAEFRFAAPDLGMMLHAALKRFGDYLAINERDWAGIEEAECRELCGAIVEELAPKLQNEILLSSARYQHLLNRIRGTVERSVLRLIDFARFSSFRPVGLEKSFGYAKDALPPLTYLLENGYEITINGQIDRIDAARYQGRQYYLVIDYKSGQAYINLLEVYYGLKLQLLTYLLAAHNASEQLTGEPALPAGILYYYLKSVLITAPQRLSAAEALKAVNKELKMPGWVLADVELLKLIDSSFNFIKVSVTQKNTINANMLNNVKTADEFMAMLNYIDELLRRTGREILDGDIAASPYELAEHTPCGYCQFAALCRFDRMMPGQEYRRLRKLDNEEIMCCIKEANN